MDIKWSDVTSPSIEYVVDDSHGVKVFEELVPNLDEYIYEICQGVCKFLYKSPDEVPYFGKLTFKLEEFDGVAWKSGEPPHITVCVSTKYLVEYQAKGGDIKEEVRGILFHEITHAYQHSLNMEISAIEGVADLVRYLAGYISIDRRVPGGNYDSSYKITGFFFDWVRAKYLEQFDFLYELNQSANPKEAGSWSWDETIESICGCSVKQLWNQYARELENKVTC